MVLCGKVFVVIAEGAAMFCVVVVVDVTATPLSYPNVCRIAIIELWLHGATSQCCDYTTSFN
jgi:hypothetical protein